MDFASYWALTLGLSAEYQSLTHWYFQSGGSDFHAYVSSFFSHLSADASRDFFSGSSLFLSALCCLDSTPPSALPPSSGPTAFPPLFAPLPSAPTPAPLPPHSLTSAFLLPPASTPLPSAPPLGISTPSVRSPAGFPSGFSSLPAVPRFPSFASAVPPPVLPLSISAPSSLSVHPSAPGFDAYLGVLLLQFLLLLLTLFCRAVSPYAVLSRPGNCHQLEEVRPLVEDLGSVPGNADGHHPGKGISVKLPDCQMLEHIISVHVTPRFTEEDVATVVWLHGLIRMVCAGWQA